jgi:hypothetical protein
MKIYQLTHLLRFVNEKMTFIIVLYYYNSNSVEKWKFSKNTDR